MFHPPPSYLTSVRCEGVAELGGIHNKWVSKSTNRPITKSEYYSEFSVHIQHAQVHTDIHLQNLHIIHFAYHTRARMNDSTLNYGHVFGVGKARSLRRRNNTFEQPTGIEQQHARQTLQNKHTHTRAKASFL